MRINLIKRHTVRHIKRAGPNPAQRQNMSVTTQCGPQIARNRPDIAALAAGHLQHHMIGVWPFKHDQCLDPQLSCGQGHLFAVTGFLIGAHPVDLDGGKLWWDLHHITDKRAQRLLDLGVGGAQVSGRNHLSLCIIGIGGLAQTHGKRITLQRIGDKRHRLGGLA